MQSTIDQSDVKKTVVVGPSMASAMIVTGLGMMAVGLGARFMLKTIPAMSQKMANNIPKISADQMFTSSKYYKGGFDNKMTTREAGLILGVRPNMPPNKIKMAYLNMMKNNHPDSGGSPYLSTKITEAKDILDKKR